MKFFNQKNKNTLTGVKNDQGVHVSSYVVKFDSLFKNKNFYKSFHEYVTEKSKKKSQKQNIVLLEFYKDVFQMQQNSSQDRLKVAESLFKKYIEGSPHKQISVYLKQVKLSTRKEREGHKDDLSCKDKDFIVVNLSRFSYYKLKNELFQGYLMSKRYLKFVKDFAASDFEAIGMKRRNAFLDYKPSRFEEDYIIREDDFTTFRQLAEDQTVWTLVGRSKDDALYAFVMDECMFVKDSRLGNPLWCKLYGVIHKNFEDVIKTIVPAHNVLVYDESVTSVEALDYLSHEDLMRIDPKECSKMEKKRGTAVFSYDIKLPFPYKKSRKYVAAVSTTYDAEKKVYEAIYKPVVHEKAPIEKNQKECIDFYYRAYRKIDEFTTQFAEIHAFDIQAKSFKYIHNASTGVRATALQKTITNAVGTMERKSFTIAEDDNIVKLCKELEIDELSKILDSCCMLDSKKI